jgi:hypothetical protein
MSAEIVNISGGTLTVKFSGLVTFDEFMANQHAAASFIRQYRGHGKVRFLAILENFQGWGREGDWGDTTLLDELDPFIERFAIVGDKQWEASVLGFTLKGLRKAAIEYFLPHDLDKARTWLAGAGARAESG